MDVFAKLRSTVSSVLPGNPATKEFELGPQTGSAGPELLWKVYDGIQRTTKQEVSVFVLEKKLLDKYAKHDKQAILDVFKRGVSQLTRLRHPKILSVLHPLEDSRDSLVFATEPVFASLANVLGYHGNLPTPVPINLRDHDLYEVEIKYGILHVLEGMSFLHNDVKMIHRNMCPESVLINKTGAWKIAGFDFSLMNTNHGVDDTATYDFVEWSSEQAPPSQPNLDYLAPEYALTKRCDCYSDIYSLAVLMYAIFNQGQPLFKCYNQRSTFLSASKELRGLQLSQLSGVPDGVREHVKLMFHVEPSLRPDAHQLAKIPFFEDVGSMTLQYLETLVQEDNLRKSQFFKGLAQVVINMPKRVNVDRILPCLFTECANPDMVPFVLPSILQISQQLPQTEYIQHILPGMIPLFKLKKPIKVLLLLMQNMDLIMTKTPQKEAQIYVLPMLFGAIENEATEIQDLALSILPSIANLVDYNSMKNAVIPRIRKLCLSTNSLGVRVNSLLCLGKLLEFVDKWFVLDEILPFLPKIPSKEPAVLMSVLGVYKVAFSHKKLGITKDILATQVLPFLIPVSIDNNLNLGQYKAFTSVVKEMLDKIETEHQSKLEQLHSMKQEQKTIHFEKVQDGNTLVSGVDSTNDDSMMGKLFTKFGLSSTVGFDGSKSVKTEKGSDGPQPSRQSTSLRQAKPTLSLEEKQRLAREQELQLNIKSQKPPTFESLGGASTSPHARDQTSTLLTSGMSSSRAQSGPVTHRKPDVSAFDSFTLTPQLTSNGQGTQGMMGNQRRGVRNQTLDTMGSQTQGIMGSQPQGMGNQHGMMVNQPLGMMGNQSQGMMVNQPQDTMGNQHGMVGNQPLGMMGNQSQGMMGNQSQGIMGNHPQGIIGSHMPGMISNQPQGGMGNQMMGATGCQGIMGFSGGSQNVARNRGLVGSQHVMSNQGTMGTGNLGFTNLNQPSKPSLSKSDIDDLLS